jgi:hypothetical protein
VSETNEWPAIPLADWQDTRDTLQLWLQIIGKVRMTNTPLINHWWNVRSTSPRADSQHR